MDRRLSQRTKNTSSRIALRNATSEAHSRLDGLISASQGVETHAAYQRLALTMMWGRSYYAQSLERAQSLLGLTDINPRLLDALKADLLSSGANGPSADKSEPITLEASTDRDLGVLYVFEGSALGARAIHRSLTYNNAVAFSAQYLEEVGEGQPLRWQMVCKALDDAICDPADAIDSARCCFHALADFVAALPASIEREMANDGVQN